MDASGMAWLNISSLKPKDLCGIPWLLAFALRADGWWLRQDIIWSKPNAMPESVHDRCTRAHEYVFMLTKSAKYFYDDKAIQEPCVCTEPFRFTDGGKDKQRGHTRRHAGFNGRYAEKIAKEGAPTHRNRRSVWEIATKPYKGAHFATFPSALVEPCILAGSRVGDTVLDPFAGSGTVGQVAVQHGRDALLIELNGEYCKLAEERAR
jgi:DNA modification methylase